jgi:hypothetical protein
MASAVKGEDGDRKSLTGISLSSQRTLLGLNRLGASLYSLGETQRQIRDAVGKQVSIVKDKQKFNLRKKQYLKDQESERQTELAGQVDAKDAIDEKEVKKEGEKKLSWLEKLLGPFKGIIEFALRAIITQGILKWISDPKNGERLGKVIKGLSAFFGFVFGIVSWSVGTFLSGVSNLFGDGSKGGFSRFAEVLGGLGQILVGLAGLKAAMYLLNPFSLISDILGLIDVISSKGPPGGGDVPQGGGSGTPKPQLNKAAQKVAENYGDDAARLYDDAIKRGRSPAAALGEVRKKFTKLPPKPTGLLGKMRQGVMDRVSKVRSGVKDTISGVKQFGAKAFDVSKHVFEKGKDLVKGTGSWIKNQAVNAKKLADVAKNPASLGNFVKDIVSNKLKPTLDKNPLVKRLFDIVKDPKNIGKNIGPLVKDAIKSKEVLKLRDYLKQVQGKAKISGLDKVIAALVGLLDYGLFGTPFTNAFLGALGGLLGYAGGFALGAPFGGIPGFIAGAAGGMAGEHIGKSLARLLGKGPLGNIEDPLMKDGRKLASSDPALAEGGLITKPTRAMIGERGPEVVIPLAMLGTSTGIGPIASMLSSSLTGALSAMGSSGELARQVIGQELSMLEKEGGPSRPANPGETLGKSVVKTSIELDDVDFDNNEEVISYLGDRSSYRKGSDRNTLRGALAAILDVFESISKKSFRSGRRSGGGGGGSGGGADGGLSATEGGISGSGIEKGNIIAKKLMSDLKISEAAAAGIVGNLLLESNLQPDNVEDGKGFEDGPINNIPVGTQRVGYGWGQWTNDRLERFRKFLKGRNADNRPATDDDNYAYLINELTTTEKIKGHWRGYNGQMDIPQDDARKAATWFMMAWERPGVPHEDRRQVYAESIYKNIKKAENGGAIKLSQGGGVNPSTTRGPTVPRAGDGPLSESRIEYRPEGYAKGGKIFLHWTGSQYTFKSKGFYHSIIQGDGSVYKAHPYDQRTGVSHTWRRNNQGVGISLAAMGGPDHNPWAVPPKDIQIESMAKEIANVAKSWGWSDKDITLNNVMTHAEAAKRKDGHTGHPDYGPGSGDKQTKWDWLQLKKGEPDWSGGDKIRAMVRGFMGGDSTVVSSDGSSGGSSGSSGGSSDEPVEKEMTPEEQLQSLMSKLTSDILKLGGGSSGEEAKTEDEKVKSDKKSDEPSISTPPSSPDSKESDKSRSGGGSISSPPSSSGGGSISSPPSSSGGGSISSPPSSSGGGSISSSGGGSISSPSSRGGSISASPASQNNLDKLSSIAADLEESSLQRTALVPIPMAINSSSASSPAPPRKVVRARKPITYGF